MDGKSVLSMRDRDGGRYSIGGDESTSPHVRFSRRAIGHLSPNAARASQPPVLGARGSIVELKPSIFFSLLAAVLVAFGLALNSPARAQVSPATVVGHPAAEVNDINLIASDAAYLYIYDSGRSTVFKIDKARMRVIGKAPLN